MWTLPLVVAMLAAVEGPAPMDQGQLLKTGDALPLLKGQFLTGRDAILPGACRGKTALLALGFTYDSRFAVEPWCERFAREFRDKREVTYFEIPVIGGMARLGKWFIDSGMRKGTPKEKQENVITVYGGSDEWKKRVGFKDPKAAYLIVLDPKGKIRWLHAGPFDEKRFVELAESVRKIIGEAGGDAAR